MIKKGPKSGSATWTADDWALFEEKGRNYFFRSDIGDRTSLSDFAHEIGNLAKFYSNDESEQFVSGIALLYAGVPYDQRGAGAMISQGMGGGARISVSSCNNQGLECAWLHHTSFGFSRKYTNVDEEENTHHFAGHLLAGYWIGSGINSSAGLIRELLEAQRDQGSFLRVDFADVRMGNVAGILGSRLKNGTIKPNDIPLMVLKFLGE